MNTREQGDHGEFAAMRWLRNRGAIVFQPFGHSPDIDLVAVFDVDAVRVQVKTSCYFVHDRWQISICTRGGNQSWSGTTKVFSPDRCDALFVLVGDGRQWYIPAYAVEGGTGLVLGGPKYAAYEVESGDPIVPWEPEIATLAPSRRDTEAVKRDGL